KPVGKLETGAGKLQRAAAKVADSVIEAAGGGKIDVAATVRRNPAASLPDSTFQPTRRRLEDGQPLLQIARVECLHEPFLRPVLIVWIGHYVSAGDIQH